MQAVDETVAQRGQLDIVINNAGGPSPGTFDSTPEDAWLDAFELSLHATIRLTKLALPHLRASGRGRVVNITSWSVREPIPNLILSNTIRPGRDRLGQDHRPRARPRGDHRQHRGAGNDRHTASARARVTGGRRQLGTGPAQRHPEEIAAAVVFLCSAPAAYITGVVLPVDGGALRGVW